MNYFTVGYRLPKFLSTPLFGDRKKYGLTVKPDDPCWTEWQKNCLDFYYSNQKKSIGAIVNNAGYKVMSKIDMTGKSILEIGPGDISHINNWKGVPGSYTIADIRQSMLDLSSAKLKASGIPYLTMLLKNNDFTSLPFEDKQFDIIISFYSLEHLYPLSPYLDDMLRVLKQGGKLVGAIPCEGGLAWGLGRFLTSRRWLKRHTNIDPDKIICWEHPNFAEDVLNVLDAKFKKQNVIYWPFGIPVIDLNLVVKFVYQKS